MHRLCKWKDFFFPDRVFLDDTLLLSFANPCWAYQLWPSQHRAGLWEGWAKITETPALVWSAILVARVGHSAFWRTICPPAAQSQAAKTKQKPAIGQLAHRVSRLHWQHERALVPGACRPSHCKPPKESLSLVDPVCFSPSFGYELHWCLRQQNGFLWPASCWPSITLVSWRRDARTYPKQMKEKL